MENKEIHETYVARQSMFEYKKKSMSNKIPSVYTLDKEFDCSGW